MKNTLTEFGKELRKFRIDRREPLKDMADKVGITAAYLSSIELGVNNVPPFLIPRIKEAYGLDDEQTARLVAARAKSIKKIKVDLSGATEEQRSLGTHFAQALTGLTDGQCAAIKGILQETGNSL